MAQDQLEVLSGKHLMSFSVSYMPHLQIRGSSIGFKAVWTIWKLEQRLRVFKFRRCISIFTKRNLFLPARVTTISQL
jgi:hypothetical protein